MPDIYNPTHRSRSLTPDQDQQECWLTPPIMQNILSTDPTTVSNDICGNKTREDYHPGWKCDIHYRLKYLPTPETEVASLEKLKSHGLLHYPKPDGPINSSSPERKTVNWEDARQHYLPMSTTSTITAASTVQVRTLADIKAPKCRSVVSFADPLVTQIYTEGLSRQGNYQNQSFCEDEKNLNKEDKLTIDLEKLRDRLERGAFISAADRRSRHPCYVPEPCQRRGFIRLHRFIANAMPLLFLTQYSWVCCMLNVEERLWAFELSILVTSCMGLYMSGFSYLSTKYKCHCKHLDCNLDYRSPLDIGPASLAIPMLFTLGILIPVLAFTLIKQSGLFDIVFLLHGFATTVFVNVWRLRRCCCE